MDVENEFSERAKIRVLHTESSLDLGGQELRVLREAEGMTKRGYPAILAVSPESRLRHEAERAGIPVEPVTFRQTRFAGLIVDFLRVIRRHEIRIVNTHGSLDSWTASLAARLSPTRPCVIRTRHKSTPVTNTARHRLLYKVLPHVIVTTGANVREQLIGQLGLCPSDVVSIPTGVDTAVFRPAARTRTLRIEVGAAPNDPLVGSVAFLRSYKGLTHLIDAAALVRRRHPGAKFLIVGDGPEKAQLMAKIQRLGLSSAVVLTGLRRDVPGILSELDVFVLPSIEGEGLPQALTQAMAMQRAVVATCVGGIPEVVRHGVTGLLVPAGDPEVLAHGIDTLLRDRSLRMRMGRAARERILNGYTLEQMLDQTEELYARLLGRRLCAPRLRTSSSSTR